jgi:hypothetical protein
VVAFADRICVEMPGRRPVNKKRPYIAGMILNHLFFYIHLLSEVKASSPVQPPFAPGFIY